MSKIKAYWDHYYNMASSGGEDHTYNCWGYAFGYSTWVQDPDYIYKDDYDSISVPEANCVSAQSGHVILVTEVSSNESTKVVTKSSEKNQPSGIYNKTYSLPNGASLDDFYKKK